MSAQQSLGQQQGREGAREMTAKVATSKTGQPVLTARLRTP